MGCGLRDDGNSEYRHLAQDESDEWRQLTSLVILGFVSSVESYCRAIIRRLLLVDNLSRRSSYGRPLSYGAAVFHSQELLPEALLESVSFHNPKNIKDAFKEFLGIQIALQKDSEINEALADYNIVGHLRHCVVHRAGLLGSKNAIELGLDEHNTFLEKPIDVNFAAIQEIGSVCENLVKLLNDRLFSYVLKRTTTEINWTGDLRKDKKYFVTYFDLFCPTEFNTADFRKKCHKDFIDSVT